VYSPDNPMNQPYMPAEVAEQIKTYDEEYKRNIEEEINGVIKSDWVKLTVAEPP
jgi:hypothetical protein